MNVKAGDIIAVESHGFIAWAIRRVQNRLGYTQEESKTTHIAVAITSYGDILEAEGTGIRLSNVRHYDQMGIKYHVLRHNKADGDEIANVAIQLSHNDKFLKKQYDFLLIIGLWLISIGTKINIMKFNSKDRFICSEYALEIFEKLDVIVPREDKAYMPAEWIRWKNEGFFKEIKQ